MSKLPRPVRRLIHHAIAARKDLEFVERGLALHDHRRPRIARLLAAVNDVDEDVAEPEPEREPDAWPPPNPECPTCGTNEDVYYRSLVPSHRWGCRGCATSFGAPPSTSASKPSDLYRRCLTQRGVVIVASKDGTPGTGYAEVPLRLWDEVRDFIRAASASEGDEASDLTTRGRINHARTHLYAARDSVAAIPASDETRQGRAGGLAQIRQALTHLDMVARASEGDEASAALTPVGEVLGFTNDGEPTVEWEPFGVTEGDTLYRLAARHPTSTPEWRPKSKEDANALSRVKDATPGGG